MYRPNRASSYQMGSRSSNNLNYSFQQEKSFILTQIVPQITQQRHQGSVEKYQSSERLNTYQDKINFNNKRNSQMPNNSVYANVDTITTKNTQEDQHIQSPLYTPINNLQNYQQYIMDQLNKSKNALNQSIDKNRSKAQKQQQQQQNSHNQSINNTLNQSSEKPIQFQNSSNYKDKKVNYTFQNDPRQSYKGNKEIENTFTINQQNFQEKYRQKANSSYIQQQFKDQPKLKQEKPAKSQQINNLAVFQQQKVQVNPIINSTSILVSDIDLSLQIYQQLLGFKLQTLSEPDKNSKLYQLTYSYYNLDPKQHQFTKIAFLNSPKMQKSLKLLEIKGDLLYQPQTKLNTIVLEVKDCLALKEPLEQLGVKTFHQDEQKINDGKVYQELPFIDNDGHVVILYNFKAIENPNQPLNLDALQEYNDKFSQLQIFKRPCFIVKNINNSLKIYQDILQMKIQLKQENYNEIDVKKKIPVYEYLNINHSKNIYSHLVILNSENCEGSFSLIEVSGEQLQRPSIKVFSISIQVKGIEAIKKQLEMSNIGIQIFPFYNETTQEGDEYKELVFNDPDGNLVVLFQYDQKQEKIDMPQQQKLNISSSKAKLDILNDSKVQEINLQPTGKLNMVTEFTTNKNEFQKYLDFVKNLIEKFGGKFSIAGKKQEENEEKETYMILSEWASKEHVLAFQSSEQYKKLLIVLPDSNYYYMEQIYRDQTQNDIQIQIIKGKLEDQIYKNQIQQEQLDQQRKKKEEMNQEIDYLQGEIQNVKIQMDTLSKNKFQNY